MDSLARLAFCPPGLPFFDRSDAGDGAGPEFVDGLAVPTGWHGQANEEWMNLAPPEAAPPAQGWKIHASAVAENAAHVLEVIAKYCFTHDVMFKFLRTPAVLQRRNGKYADRGASGKFVTIYPGSEEQFGQILIELGGLLDGEPGPYILSDLRWRDGPLYVRYGGIVPLVVRGPDGRPVYCVRTPAGELVEDRRGPGFRPPEWVSLPPVLDAAIAARNAGTLRNFPYRVDRALHFSNGGGVYRATAVPDGREVLVREARPLAGLDAGGRDAVARLAAERDALQRLSGVDGIPALIDFRRGHEHRYLIREYVPGRSLAQEMIRRNPLFAAREPDRADPGWADHAEWALAILARVDHTLGEMHRRGVVFHDLHPANVLVRPDGGIALIDFETATSVDDPAPQLIGAPGFVAPDGYTGTAVDRYALGCLRLVVFAPLAAAVPLGRTKVAELLAFIGELFPLPAGFAGSVWADLGPAFAAPAPAGRPVTPPATTRASRVAGPAGDAAAGRPAGRVPDSRAVASGILATATPDRADRLYPGDARQFTHPEGGVDLATGAAGVQLALAATGRPVPADHVDWLAAAAGRLVDPRPGLVTGLAGIALALDRLGRPAAAAALFERLAAGPLPDAPGLADGAAGIGLALTIWGRRRDDAAAVGRARDIARRLIGGPGDGLDPAAGGLFGGGSGIALFLLRLARIDPDPRLAAAAVRAWRADADRFRDAHDRARSAGDPGPGPGLATGWAGPAMVAGELLRQPLSADDRRAVRSGSASARAAMRRSFQPGAGLFDGCAGTVVALSRLAGSGTGAEPEPGADADLERRADRAASLAARRCLDLFAVEHDGHPAYLGAEALRLSADLSTGAAGVLLALHAVETGAPAPLPFLDLPAGAPEPVAAPEPDPSAGPSAGRIHRGGTR